MTQLISKIDKALCEAGKIMRKNLKIILTIAFLFSLINTVSFGGSENLLTHLFIKNPTVPISKTGKASKDYYFGVIGLGDDSLQQALINGGITKIHHVETKKEGNHIKATVTKIVYGE